MSETRWEQTQGVFFQDDFSAETVQLRWAEATSFENARHASKISESKSGINARMEADVALSPQ